MRRMVLLTLCALVAAAGCQEPQQRMDAFEKPSPPAELAKLTRFVGTWSGTAEMVDPSPEEMKKMMPEGSADVQESYAGGGTMEWTLGGMFLTGEGWHEMGEGKKAHYVEFWTWDPKARKFRSYFFSDWGEHGEGTANFDASGDTMKMKYTGYDAHGAKKSGSGTMTFTDDNTMEWTVTESGPMGKMKIKGTSKRTS